MRTRWMAIVIGLLAAGAATSLRAENTSEARVIDGLAHTYTTPKALATFLHRTFTFTHDEELFGREDYWQSPGEFLTRKAGDCEDYAILAQAVLSRNGIQAYLFSVFGDGGYAHTVCVFVDEHGRYNLLNQDRLRYYRASSLEALASLLCPAWTFGGIAERAGTRGRLVNKIVNFHPAPALLVMNPVPGSSF